MRAEISTAAGMILCSTIPRRERASAITAANPEKLLVTGYSAGGFGTALLTDDVMSLFPHCKDVTCLVDSGVFSYDGWHETAEKQWKAPEEIVSRIHSDNIALDCLLALHRDHGDVKIALACSYRDALLAQCEGYAHGQGKLVFSKENGDVFQATLSKTVKTLQEEIPGVALYIFDKPSTEPGVKEEHGLTEHTFLDRSIPFWTINISTITVLAA